MDFNKIFSKDVDDWLFNSLGIESFSSTSKSRLRHWFNHLKNNHNSIEGDIFEFGVYKGDSIIAMAILLNILGSKKMIYGFDSFSGFPNYHENDNLKMFDKRKDLFDPEHRRKAKLCKKIAEFRLEEKVDPSKISTSGDFSDASRCSLENRIEKFKLNNIHLVEGSFEKTLPNFFKNFTGSIFSANIDCDLYTGCHLSLEHIYDKCNPNSMIYLDEYYSLKFPGARIDVDEFLINKKDTTTLLSKDVNDFERWAIIKS